MKNGNIRFEYPSPWLDQANHKNNCQNFPTQKNLEIKNSNCRQILQSSLSLEIRSTPTPPPPPLPPGLKPMAYHRLVQGIWIWHRWLTAANVWMCVVLGKKITLYFWVKSNSSEDKYQNTNPSKLPVTSVSLQVESTSLLVSRILFPVTCSRSSGSTSSNQTSLELKMIKHFTHNSTHQFKKCIKISSTGKS